MPVWPGVDVKFVLLEIEIYVERQPWLSIKYHLQIDPFVPRGITEIVLERRTVRGDLLERGTGGVEVRLGCFHRG